MSHATLDHVGDDAHDAGVAGLVLASIGGTMLIWQGLIWLVPALDSLPWLHDPEIAKFVSLALYLASGFAFYWFVVRRVRDAVGIGPLTRFTTFWYSLVFGGYAMHQLWQHRLLPGFPWEPFPWSPVTPFVCVLISVMGHHPETAKRLFAGRVCIVGVAVSWCLLMGRQQALALDVAGIAAAGGLAWVAYRTDFRALFRLICGQVMMEWYVSASGDIVKYGLRIALSFVLYFGSGVFNRVHPGVMKDWQEVLISLFALYLFFSSIWKLLSVARRLLTSLIPASRPGFSTVAGQKVHGDAGYADTIQVDAALRDQDLGGRQPHFRD